MYLVQSCSSGNSVRTPRVTKKKATRMHTSRSPVRDRNISKQIDFLNDSSQRSLAMMSGESSCTDSATLHRAALSFDSLSQDSNTLHVAFSQSSNSYRTSNPMPSQDEMDFLTPQDQPVLHITNPNSPSPLKKRYRPTRFLGDNMEDDMMNLTQEMVVLDVRSRGMQNSQPDEEDDVMHTGPKSPAPCKSDRLVAILAL